jgi:hypothetical protein
MKLPSPLQLVRANDGEYNQSQDETGEDEFDDVRPLRAGRREDDVVERGDDIGNGTGRSSPALSKDSLRRSPGR